jgi:hypothetical protein
MAEGFMMIRPFVASGPRLRSQFIGTDLPLGE